MERPPNSSLNPTRSNSLSTQIIPVQSNSTLQLIPWTPTSSTFTPAPRIPNSDLQITSSFPSGSSSSAIVVPSLSSRALATSTLSPLSYAIAELFNARQRLAQDPIDRLHSDALLLVFDKLSMRDLVSCGFVSRRWQITAMTALIEYLSTQIGILTDSNLRAKLATEVQNPIIRIFLISIILASKEASNTSNFTDEIAVSSSIMVLKDEVPIEILKLRQASAVAISLLAEVNESFAGWDLRGTHLENAYLANANLQEADLREADLSSANLESANLRGARMEHSNLENANLSQAELEGVKIDFANTRNTRFPVFPGGGNSQQTEDDNVSRNLNRLLNEALSQSLGEQFLLSSNPTFIRNLDEELDKDLFASSIPSSLPNLFLNENASSIFDDFLELHRSPSSSSSTRASDSSSSSEANSCPSLNWKFCQLF